MATTSQISTLTIIDRIDLRGGHRKISNTLPTKIMVIVSTMTTVVIKNITKSSQELFQKMGGRTITNKVGVPKVSIKRRPKVI